MSMLSSLVVGTGAIWTGVSSVVGWNRDAWFTDVQVDQARRYQEQAVRLQQADMCRDDIRDLVQEPVSKLNSYTLMTTLILPLTLQALMEGHVPEVTDTFTSIIYRTCLCTSIFLLVLSILYAVQAVIKAMTAQKIFLTLRVRKPINEVVEEIHKHKMRESSEAFEHQELQEVFRPPFVNRVRGGTPQAAAGRRLTSVFMKEHDRMRDLNESSTSPWTLTSSANSYRSNDGHSPSSTGGVGELDRRATIPGGSARVFSRASGDASPADGRTADTSDTSDSAEPLAHQEDVNPRTAGVLETEETMKDVAEHVAEFHEQEQQWQDLHDLSLLYAAMGVSNLIQAWGYYFAATPIIAPSHGSGLTLIVSHTTLQFAMVLLNIILCLVFLKMTTMKQQFVFKWVIIITLCGPLARTLAVIFSCECKCNQNNHLYRCACGDFRDHGHRCFIVLSAFFHFLWNALAVGLKSLARDLVHSAKLFLQCLGEVLCQYFSSEPHSPGAAVNTNVATSASAEVSGPSEMEGAPANGFGRTLSSSSVPEHAINQDVAGKTCGGLIVVLAWLVLLLCSVPFIGFSEPEGSESFCNRFFTSTYNAGLPDPAAAGEFQNVLRPPWEDAALTPAVHGLSPQPVTIEPLTVSWGDQSFRPHAISCAPDGRVFLSDEFRLFELQPAVSGSLFLEPFACQGLYGSVTDVAAACDSVEGCFPLALLRDPADVVVNCITGEHMPLKRGIASPAQLFAADNGTRLFTAHSDWVIERELVGSASLPEGRSWRPQARVARAHADDLRSVAVVGNELWFFYRSGLVEGHNLDTAITSKARLAALGSSIVLSGCASQKDSFALLLLAGQTGDGVSEVQLAKIAL